MVVLGRALITGGAIDSVGTFTHERNGGVTITLSDLTRKRFGAMANPKCD
jgi:hypothetical protein